MATKEKYIEALDHVIDSFAFLRRMAETEGIDVEALDREADKLCEKYYEKYASMNQMELAIKGMTDMIKQGHGDKLAHELEEMLGV